MSGRVTRIVVLLTGMTLLAARATAPTPAPPLAAHLDLCRQPVAQEHVQPLPCFSESSFAGVRHVEVPTPPTELRAYDVVGYDPGQRGVFTRTRSGKLASGVRVFGGKSNINGETS